MMETEEIYPILDNIKTQATDPRNLLPYSLPPGYFDRFYSVLMQRIQCDQEEELATFAPVLASLSKKTPFKVPNQYFSQGVGVPTQSAKLIPFKRGLAIAASIIAATLISFFLLTRETSSNFPDDPLYATSTIHKLSNEQLENFLPPESGAPKERLLSEGQLGTKNPNKTSLFQNIPDGELTNFLNDTEDGTDDLLLN